MNGSDSQLPIVVAEIGLNHNGSIEMAEAMISMAKSFGADYVKFQKRDIEKAYTRDYLSKRKSTSWGSSVRDEKYGLEFSEKDYDRIDAYCKSVGIRWFASMWDPGTVDFLMKYKPPFFKVGSACTNHWALIEKLMTTGVPLVVSTGMTDEADITKLVQMLQPTEKLAYLLHCVSVYPCPDYLLNLRRIETLRRKFEGVKVGFSCHSEKIIYPVAAFAMGAEMIEIHVTLDRSAEGPDHEASIGPNGFHKLMTYLRSASDGMGSGEIAPKPEEMSRVRSGQYPWRTK